MTTEIQPDQINSTNLDAATLKGQPWSALVPPTGSIFMYVLDVAPDGWLKCDGSSKSTTTYASLYTVIGYTYGGSGPNFNLPDLRRRTAVGSGGTGTGTLGNTLNSKGGEEIHILSVNELPSHTHIANTHGHATYPHNHRFVYMRPVMTGDVAFYTGPVYFINPTSTTTTTDVNDSAWNTDYSGGNTNTTGSVSPPHNNIQPSIVLNYIIKT